jgi:hypothetical protein
MAGVGFVLTDSTTLFAAVFVKVESVSMPGVAIEAREVPAGAGVLGLLTVSSPAMPMTMSVLPKDFMRSPLA